MHQHSLQFIHLTDLHVDAAGPHHGIDAGERLERCIAHIARHFPQAAFIAVTGDLTERGDAASYQQLLAAFSLAPCPVFTVPGNHDAPLNMAQVFGRSAMTSLAQTHAPGRCLWTEILETPLFDAIFLNTHQDGCAGGRLQLDSLTLLHEVLCKPSKKPVLLFMHHPPFASGIACMDAIGLSNSEALRHLLTSAPRQPAGIFCGHLHRTMAGIWHHIPVWCLRSVVQQVDIHATEATRVTYCHETPEYAVVSLGVTAEKTLEILSQTVRFTEPSCSYLSD